MHHLSQPEGGASGPMSTQKKETLRRTSVLVEESKGRLSLIYLVK